MCRAAVQGSGSNSSLQECRRENQPWAGQGAVWRLTHSRQLQQRAARAARAAAACLDVVEEEGAEAIQVCLGRAAAQQLHHLLGRLQGGQKLLRAGRGRGREVCRRRAGRRTRHQRRAELHSARTPPAASFTLYSNTSSVPHVFRPLQELHGHRVRDTGVGSKHPRPVQRDGVKIA